MLFEKNKKKTIDLQVFGDVRKFDYNILKDIEHVIYLAAVSNDPMGNKFIKPTLDIIIKVHKNCQNKQRLKSKHLLLLVVAQCMDIKII